MSFNKNKINLPYLLIFFRLLLAPLIICISWYYNYQARFEILVLMYLGLLSDIFDGIIARHLKISSEKMRRMDSQVDLVFWLSIGISTCLIELEILFQNKYSIILLFVMEGLCYGTSLLKFKKETSTHSFLSKIWGLSLLVAFTCILAYGIGGLPFQICVVIGLISQLDVILIILLLPKWQHDIPSFYHAYLIRKGKTFKKNKLLNS